MKDRIIDYLTNETGAKTIIEINDFLGLKTSDELYELQCVLDSLEKEGIVHGTKKGKYLLLENCSSLRTGKLEVTSNGFGFLLQDNDDIYISKDNLNGAINDDTVLVDTFSHNGKIEGKVLKVLDRKLDKVVGEILFVNGEPTLILDDKKANIEVKLENHFANLVDGHKVLVELVKQLGQNKFLGLVTKIIGHKNDPNIDILSVASKYGIELEFSEESINELKKIPDSLRDKDKVGRVDLTKEEIFTIDGDDTKDIDDAISLKKIDDYYELGVHIADVSYYVKPGMALYDDAYKKGTSSYLADTVLPMLPHELSNGICSLNPGVERLAISCVMKINDKGAVFDYDIFPSIIKSRKQMTYKCVNKILMENIVPEGYEEYKDTLILMNELATILRKRKVNNGYLDFSIPEAKIIQDENGKCIDVIKKESFAGEKLIEDFMIAANETIATHFSNMDIPFIYRIHGLPKEEKINDFLHLLNLLNININTRKISISSRSMQKIIEGIKDNDGFQILSEMLLRSMQKAVYSTVNIGHFGLGLSNYTHFTSPIRRFPDTTVHGLIRTYLFEKRIDSDTIKYYEKELSRIADWSSEREQASIDAEREVDDMKIAEFMEDKIGNIYEGMITSVSNFGFFVRLDNLIEGLVHVSSLPGYFEYNEDELALINTSNKKCYRLGDKVKVRVIGANKELREVDFEVADGDN